MTKRILCLLLSIAMIVSMVACSSKKDNSSSAPSKTQSENKTSSQVSSNNESSSEASSSSQAPVSSAPSSTASPKPAAPKPTPTPVVPPTNPPKYTETNYTYSSNIDINDNIFMDSLVYTGYNIEKHRADGLMWVYVLASQKRAKGWLSPIGYHGTATGYETDANGKPDINYFGVQKKGLVCASYVTYVYFNYLPNVAGIDTSFLTKPVRSYKAEDWRKAALDWVAKGYSKTIDFTASKTGSGFIVFNPKEQIPIGSILVFCDAKNKKDCGSHVCVYAGHKNNNHWVYHVGNDNGPEFCSVERMHFGLDPQWPIWVITPPLNIRMAACLDLTLEDQDSKGISGVTFKAKNTKTGTEYNVGTTNASGKLTLEGLPFGNYTLTHTPPAEYTSEQASISVTLTNANNSLNKIKITDKKAEKQSETE